jgi:uncharacterized UBP type Zn finger protein
VKVRRGNTADIREGATVDPERAEYLTGIRNTGNTCYLHSVIQGLSQCTGFVDALENRENRMEDLIVPKNDDEKVAREFIRLATEVRKRSSLTQPNSLLRLEIRKSRLWLRE